MTEFRFASVPDDAELYDLLNKGLALYADGQPFEAHELWEYAWKGEVGRTKLTLQAIIQIAAALHKHGVGVPGGTCKLLAKAEAKLDEVMGGCSAWLGFDLVALREAVRVSLAQADDVYNQQATQVAPPMLPDVSGPDGILYLHGFASSPRSKKVGLIAEPLRQSGLHVSVPDLNEGDFSQLTISRALALAKRHLRDRTVVIGSSLGGYIASLLAAKDDRVKALVLMAPAFDFAASLAARPDADLEGWRKRGFADIDHYGTGRPEPLSFGFYEDACTHAAYAPLRVPTYILHGLRDDVVHADRSRQAVERAKVPIELELVDDEHSLIESAPRALAAARQMVVGLGLRPQPPAESADVVRTWMADDRRFD